MDFIIEILVLIFMIIAFVFYRKRKHRMNILLRNGIRGPQPSLLTGNLKEYESMPNVIWDTYLIETYGPIVGYYLGAKPVVLVGDVELLYKIQRTDSTLFLERPRRVPGGINPDPHRALMLGNLPVEEWKKIRKILSPSFNATNLKDMTPSILTLIDVLIKNIVTEVETDFYVKFQNLTLDIIGRTAFGLESNIQENSNDPLVQAVAAEFSKSTSSTLVKLYLCLPELSFILHPIRILIEKIRVRLGLSPSSPLWDQGRFALQHRNDSEINRKDLLQKLVSSKEKLSDDQIVANSVLFFEASYETLSSSLAFTLHLLVNHPEVQQKLREEIQEHLDEYGEINFNIYKKLPYMDRVIKEALRCFPPQTTFIGRAPSEDYHYESSDKTTNITIPKGTHVQVALFQIQNSVEKWKNPEQFDPDRFLEIDDKDKMDWWQPFGVGRRECIGKGFANLVLKLMLAKLCGNYTLHRCSYTEEDGKVKIEYKTATMTPKNGSWLKASPVAA